MYRFQQRGARVYVCEAADEERREKQRDLYEKHNYDTKVYLGK